MEMMTLSTPKLSYNPLLSPIRAVNVPIPTCSSAFNGVLSSFKTTTPLRWSKKSSNVVTCVAKVREITESEFSDVVLKSEIPVLVEFVATWCGPCRLIAPAVQALAQEYQGKLEVVKIDHDSNPKLIEEYKVYGLPTLIIFQNGQEVSQSRKEGAITKAKLKAYVDTFLESVSAV